MFKTLICFTTILTSVIGANATAQPVQRLRSPFVLSSKTANGALATFVTERTAAVTWDILAVRHIKDVSSITVKRTYIKSDIFTEQNFGVAEIKCKKKMARWVAWGTNEKVIAEYDNDAQFSPYDDFSMDYPYFDYACSRRK
jgi:hypothetical protein